MVQLRQEAEQIYTTAIHEALPDVAVKQALCKRTFSEGQLLLVAVGKAGWQMANAAMETLGDRVTRGIVITKYGYAMGALPKLEMIEAGHPIPDENSFLGTEKALRMTANLTAADTVLFLLSGGGSALFEKSALTTEELQDINAQLLASGASIQEINTIRKCFSQVKGGRFALHCAPAKIVSIILSDVVGDQINMIASGPTCADTQSPQSALQLANHYRLRLSPTARALLVSARQEIPDNVENQLCGSVRQLCRTAERVCQGLGYTTEILTESLDCEAKDAGELLGKLLSQHRGTRVPLAFIAGGETVVKITGTGKGGRNQELAMAASPWIAGLKNACVFSVGSDGTDGPTDAAGGYVDTATVENLCARGISVSAILQSNDSYHALKKCGGLIMTGPTGTNVNDLSVALIRPEK